MTRQGHEFFVHEELLCRESDKFKKQLRGQFKEAETGVITDVDESPELLGLFFEYLYGGGQLRSSEMSHDWELVILARLYCMAERLCATNFQNEVLWKFSMLCGNHPDYKILDWETIQLLLVCHTELPARPENDYHLRQQVLWIAATRLSGLKNIPEFRKIFLDDHPDLGGQILMFMGTRDPRKKPDSNVQKPKSRFEPQMKFTSQVLDDLDARMDELTNSGVRVGD